MIVVEYVGVHSTCGLGMKGSGGGVGMCTGLCVCRLADHMREHGEGINALCSVNCSKHIRPGDKCVESVGYD